MTVAYFILSLKSRIAINAVQDAKDNRQWRALFPSWCWIQRLRNFWVRITCTSDLFYRWKIGDSASHALYPRRTRELPCKVPSLQWLYICDLAFYRLVRSILFVGSSQQVVANNIMLLLKSAAAMRRCLHVCGYGLVVCSHAYIMLSQKSCNLYCSKPHFCIFFNSCFISFDFFFDKTNFVCIFYLFIISRSSISSLIF